MNIGKSVFGVLRFVAVAVVASVSVVCGTSAETPTKKIHVGILMGGFEPSYQQAEQEFLAGMSELGYVEGKNLVVERRYAHLQTGRMASGAKELAGMDLDAIVTGCTGSTRAAQRATSSIPIVMASVADPVGQGFVKSIAQSGTNVTGRSSQSRDLLPKMLEFFHTAVPQAGRVAVLINKRNPVHEALFTVTRGAAESMDIELLRLETQGPKDLDATLARLAEARAQGLIVLPDDPMAFNHRGKIVAAANKLGLPSVSGYREFVDDGGFMSYGEKCAESYRHTVTYIDKVVQGARPSELPIEQPTRFELVINLKTASALGVTVPKELLLRADQTIR